MHPKKVQSPVERGRPVLPGSREWRESLLGCGTGSHQTEPLLPPPAEEQGRPEGCPWFGVRNRPGEGNWSQTQPWVAGHGHGDGNGLRMVQEVNLLSESGNSTGSVFARSFSSQTLRRKDGFRTLTP